MGLAYDLVVASVITMIAVVIHFIGIELVAPGTPLFDMAVENAANLDGAAKASLWFQIFVVWIPMIGIGGIWLWTVIKAYKRQVQTAVRPPS